MAGWFKSEMRPFWDKVQVQVFSWYEGNQEMDNFNKNFSQLFGKVLT